MGGGSCIDTLHTDLPVVIERGKRHKIGRYYRACGGVGGDEVSRQPVSSDGARRTDGRWNGLRPFCGVTGEALTSLEATRGK